MVLLGTILIAAEATAASSGGIGAIGLDGKALLFQLINFAILFWVLKKVAFKPIIKVLEERRARIEESLKMAHEIEQNQQKMVEAQALALKQARAEAAEIVAQTRAEAADMLKNAETKMAAQNTKMLADAKSRIEQELAEAKKGLKREVTGLVVAVTEAVLGEKVDAKKDEALIERALQETGAGK